MYIRILFIFAKHTAPCIIGPHKFPGNILEAKFALLHYFLYKILRGKRYSAPPCPKVGGHVPLKLGPCIDLNLTRLKVSRHRGSFSKKLGLNLNVLCTNIKTKIIEMKWFILSQTHGPYHEHNRMIQEHKPRLSLRITE